MTLSKTLLAAMAALSLGLGVAQATTTVQTQPQAPQVQLVDNEEDDDGWFGWFGHHGDHHGRHGHDRDDDQAQGRAPCQPGTQTCPTSGQSSGKPPANGLFQGDAAPKAQVN